MSCSKLRKNQPKFSNLSVSILISINILPAQNSDKKAILEHKKKISSTAVIGNEKKDLSVFLIKEIIAPF